jgi:hypothetical protein
MSKVEKKLTFKQEGLFQKGSLDVSEMFRSSVSEAIKKSQYSGEQIVEFIYILTNQKISKNVLDQATSSKQGYRLPAEILHALCIITGSIEPFKVLLGSIGCEVLAPDEHKDLKILRLIKEKERIEKEIERLKKEEE